MLQPRLAGRYAKSLIDLALESNQLEAIHADMLFLQSVCKQSREFVNLMRSPVVTADKKLAVLEAIAGNRISRLTASFNKLLVQKGREGIFTEIIAAAIAQYNKIKDIHKVKLTTAQPISNDLRASIESKMKADTGLVNIELETVVKDELIGGFVLEYDNNLIDASILRDLKDIKKQFRNNDYILNIR